MKSIKVNTPACILCLILLLCERTGAQSRLWKTKDAYLGQLPPNDTPKIFARSILAGSSIVLGRVAFSKNGKEFYYTYSKHWFDNDDSGVKQILFNGKSWDPPKVIVEKLANPALSKDEKTMYLGGISSEVWKSIRVNDTWSKPVLFLNQKYGLYNFQPTTRGIYYAGSNANQGKKNDFSTYDFCTLTITKKDTVVRSLGLPLNTPGFDGDLFVAPDESYMIVSANETKTYECELHISFRNGDKSWTKPVSLGDLINHGLAHRFGQYVSPDGKYLFYTKGTSETDSRIYWVRFDKLLKKMKKQAKV
ncbi:MAG: hypothetical protein ABIR66_09355 [Saprospiraceae bacterium]